MKKIKNNIFNIRDLNNDLINYCINNSTDNKSNLEGKNIGLIFEKPSTRTRLSFSVGISQLKGNPLDIRFQDLNFSRNETFEDTFKAMDCYLDGLIYRTSNHDNLIKASKFFSKPIINGLSDISHPCQALGDLFTLFEHFKTLKLNILWVGDMNNVCYSLVEIVNLLKDLNLIILTPKEIETKNKWSFSKNVSVFNETRNFNLSEIDCVMTDVYISMNDLENNEKSELLSSFQVNKELIDKTSKNSVFMHCLPAKVGKEVTREVIEGPKSIVWKQAKNRMHAQKRLMQCLDW